MVAVMYHTIRWAISTKAGAVTASSDMALLVVDRLTVTGRNRMASFS